LTNVDINSITALRCSFPNVNPMGTVVGFPQARIIMESADRT
jgi:hypothetical protein